MLSNTERERLHRLAAWQLAVAYAERGYFAPNVEEVTALLDTRDRTRAGQAECFAMLDDREARMGIDVSRVRVTLEQLHGISAEDSYHVHQRG